MQDEPEGSRSHSSKKRLARWAKARGGRSGLSREALEREAAAEIGLTGAAGLDEPPDPQVSGGPGAPERRVRKQWSRLREALATESDAARRERLEREAADEMRSTSRRPDLDDDF